MARAEDIGQLIDLIPEYVEVVDSNWNVMWASRELKKKFGNIIGKKCYKVYKTNGQKCRNCPLKKRLAPGKVYPLEVDGVKNRRTFEIRHAKIPCNGKSAIIEVMRDVTELRKAEALRRNYEKELEREVRGKTGELEARNRLLENFKDFAITRENEIVRLREKVRRLELTLGRKKP